MKVDDSVANIVNAWNPNWNSSWIFYGRKTVTPSPSFKDSNNNGFYDSVLLGSSLLAEESISISKPTLLCIIELQARTSPSQAALNIDNADSYILNWDLETVPIEKIDAKVSIVGALPTKLSQITLEVNPKVAFVGQNITFSGRIIHDRPDVIVKIKEQSLGQIATAKTNKTSQYEITYSFPEPGIYTLTASWDGDQTYMGSESEKVDVTIIKPYTTLKVEFAAKNQTQLGSVKPGTIGKKPTYAQLPTPPSTINVTISNVTDLYRWRVKIYYDPFYVRVGNLWLPQDSILNKTGLKYNFTAYLGMDEYGSYIYSEATIIEPKAGYTGNGTLFQFNISGLFPTHEKETQLKLASETTLQNSRGEIIYYEGLDLSFRIVGQLPTIMEVRNPKTGKNDFTFYSEETPIGTRFNATIVILNVTSMYGWTITMTYNATLLAIKRIVQPLHNSSYVFYGLRSEFNYTINEENGTFSVLNVLSEPANPYTGDGLLCIIEFEILLAPSNVTKELKCALTIESASYKTATTWEPVQMNNGLYTFKYGKPKVEELTISIVSIREYWPHIIIFIAIVIGAYTALKRVMEKRRQIQLKEVEEET
jgi:hypothetical protein